MLSFACVLVPFQELKHLRSVGKKVIVYPGGFPGGLKGLVKSVLEEYGKQFNEKAEDDVPRGVTAGSPSLSLVSHAFVLPQAMLARLTAWKRLSSV